jgi:hypothetical protein
MRLGYTVLLEWGNSIYTTNGIDKEILRNTLIEETFFKSAGSEDEGSTGGHSYFTFLKDIENKRKTNFGNYDALLGKVSNFNWSFSADGSYDIELTIISLGDVIESLKSNLSVDKNTNKFLQSIGAIEKAEVATQTGDSTEEGVIDEENSADIISAMLAVYKFVNNNLKDPGGVQITTSEPTIHDIGARLHPNEGDTTITVDAVDVEFILKYITLQEREDQIERQKERSDDLFEMAGDAIDG